MLPRLRELFLRLTTYRNFHAILLPYFTSMLQVVLFRTRLLLAYASSFYQRRRKSEKENQQKKERKRRFTLILGKNEAKLLHCPREKQKKFLKIIFFRCNNFHSKKASNRVRGKNNTLPPLAQSRIRICK